MDEIDKLRQGAPFDSWAPEIVAQRDRVATVLHEAASAPSAQRRDLFLSILGAVGEGTIIQPPFTCEFGLTITFGRRCFVNFGVTVLDNLPVTVGDHVLIGPQVQLYTVGHPIEYERRRDWSTVGAPIVIEDDVWLGGAVIVQPGVTIGARSIVAAGSVVTRDIPPDSLAMGMPARVVRSLEVQA